MSNAVRVERLSGEALIPYIPELARLRLQVFRSHRHRDTGSHEIPEF